jgi:hypothetical protein
MSNPAWHIVTIQFPIELDMDKSAMDHSDAVAPVVQAAVVSILELTSDNRKFSSETVPVMVDVRLMQRLYEPPV